MKSHGFGKALIVLVGAFFLITACAEGAGQKETGGMLLGAILGGVAGAQFGDGTGRLIATGIGTLAGAFIGSEVGKSLDRADRLAMARTSQQTLESTPSGSTSKWRNPDSGNYGTFTPTRTFQRNDGKYCREYQQTVTVGGDTKEAHGTACRQPDGTWQIVNN